MKPSVLAFLAASLLPVHTSAQETNIVIDDTAQTILESTSDGALLLVSIFKPDEKLDAESTCIFTDDHKSPDNVPDKVEGAYTAAGADVEKKFGKFYRQTRDGIISGYVQELAKIALRINAGDIRTYYDVRNTHDVPKNERIVLEEIAANHKTPFGAKEPFTLIIAEDALGNTYFTVAGNEKRGTFWLFVKHDRYLGNETRINLYQSRDATATMIRGLGSTLQTLQTPSDAEELKLNPAL